MSMHVNKNTKLIVLDFETLGTNVETCPVMALGVVVGNVQGDIDEMEEFIFPLVGQINDTKLVSQDTVDFWNRKENKSQFDLYLSICFAQTKGINDVMQDVHKFIFNYTYLDDNYLFVGNSPEFDLSLLENLFKRIGIDTQFNYQQKFDFRSARYLLELAEVEAIKPTNNFPHNALADAEWEYKSLVDYISYIKGINDINIPPF